MDQLCSAAACACFIGVITSVIGIISPSDKLEGLIRTVMSMIFILVIVKGIGGIDTEKLTETEAYSVQTMLVTENADRYFIMQAEENVSAALKEHLDSKEINADKISVSIDISENGSIYISEVNAQTDKGSVSSAAEALKEAVGEEVTINVKITDGDNNDTEN
ncbi:MAG: hypothetical protein IJ446_10205 [Oscillospiraceae bacterium]|nr:hypothetical protein [Oscillospiraceae bacterium]